MGKSQSGTFLAFGFYTWVRLESACADVEKVLYFCLNEVCMYPVFTFMAGYICFASHRLGKRQNTRWPQVCHAGWWCCSAAETSRWCSSPASLCSRSAQKHMQSKDNNCRKSVGGTRQETSEQDNECAVNKDGKSWINCSRWQRLEETRSQQREDEQK